MKNLLMSASAVALSAVVFCGAEVAWGQSGGQGGAAATPAASAPHKVALIDMAYVFKNYKKFENLREDLKAEITQSEEEAKTKAMALQEMQKKMKTFAEGSQEFTAAESQMAKHAAEFEAFRRAAQREFLKKESQIYHTVYMETADAVGMYARHYQYTLVMRFNREDLDTENAQKLIEGMNRQVVFHRPEDDITLSVTEYLNKKFDRASVGGGAAPKSAAGAPKSQTR